jgi:hypothetical protein
MACTMTSLLVFAAFGALAGFVNLARLKERSRVREVKTSNGPVIA